DRDLVSLAVFIQQVPEGLAVGALRRRARQSLGGSVGLTFAVGAFTFAGLGIGLALGVTAGPQLRLSLAAVAGSFLYLAAVAFNFGRAVTTLAAGAGVAVAGACLIFLVRLVTR